MPGLGNIPFFGRLFQSRALSRTKSELLVVVTPEVVRPLPAGSAPPQLAMDRQPLKDGDTATPAAGTPDPAPLPSQPTIPVEQLLQQKQGLPPAPLAQKGPGKGILK